MKAWIYRIPETIALAALAGLIARRPARLAAPLAILAVSLIALIWGILVYYSAQGVPNLPGWYLWPFASAIGVLVTAGLSRCTIALVAVLALIDIYGASTLLAPYFAGLVARNHGDITLLPQALARLDLGWPLLLAWLIATLAIPAFTLTAPRNPA